jgi:hypothetical protein
LQALGELSLAGFGVQTAFLRTLLSFGRFALQSGDLVVQLGDLGLPARILSGKVVQLRFQGNLVSSSLGPDP